MTEKYYRWYTCDLSKSFPHFINKDNIAKSIMGSVTKGMLDAVPFHCFTRKSIFPSCMFYEKNYRIQAR